MLDNYDPSQVKDPTDYLPSRSSGAILLITRHKSLLPASGNVISLPIYRDAEELTILRAEPVDRTKSEDVEAVGRLLANGADPDSHGEKDWPCLHIASKEASNLSWSSSSKEGHSHGHCRLGNITFMAVALRCMFQHLPVKQWFSSYC